MRLTKTFPDHVGIATRNAAGATTGMIYCGEFRSGQLVLKVVSLGAGAWVQPKWQASLDRSGFGTLLSGSTAVATGTYILRAIDGLGAWCRAAWNMSGTAGQFGIGFVLSE